MSHDAIALAHIAGIDAAGWVAIGLFVASVGVSLVSWFVLRRENWRDEVDKTLERHRLKFERIAAHCNLDLDIDE